MHVHELRWKSAMPLPFVRLELISELCILCGQTASAKAQAAERYREDAAVAAATVESSKAEAALLRARVARMEANTAGIGHGASTSSLPVSACNRLKGVGRLCMCHCSARRGIRAGATRRQQSAGANPMRIERIVGE